MGPDIDAEVKMSKKLGFILFHMTSSLLLFGILRKNLLILFLKAYIKILFFRAILGLQKN